MNKMRLVILTALLAIGLFAGSVDIAASQALDPYAPQLHGVPEKLAGYKVLAVLTDTNFVCMREGEKRLVLQSLEENVDKMTRNFQKSRVMGALANNNKSDYLAWGWDVVGPGITREEYITQVQRSFEFFKEEGCHQFTQISAGVAAGGGEIKVAPPSQGFAVIQNTDAGKYTDDNAQSVSFVAPVFGSNQQAYSGLLNNVMTETDFFLQVGFAFYQDHPEVIWTDTSVGLIGQPLNINYTPGLGYWFTVTFTNGSWWMCGNGTEYACHADPAGTGTQLKLDLNTSVFAENWNPNLDWYQGFSPEWEVYGAKIYRNELPQDWSGDAKWTEDGCPKKQKYPPSKAISGRLARNGIASFILIGVPPFCGQ